MVSLKIVFTRHAAAQIAERALPSEAVYQTLAKPDDKIYQEPGVFLFQKRFSWGDKDYLVRVWAREEGNAWVVITAYRTSKLKKYWRGGH